MKIEFWKKIAENYKEPVNMLLDRLYGKETEVNLAECLTGNEKETLELIKDYKILKSVEENFQVEIILGFKGDWSVLFSEQMYGAEAKEDDEISENVYNGVAGYMTDMITSSFEKIGFEFFINSFNIIDVKKAKSILNLQAYYISKWNIEVPAGNEDQGELEFIFALSEPSEEILGKYSKSAEDNPAVFGPEFSKVALQIVENMKIGDESIEGGGNVKVNNNSETSVEFEPFEKSGNVKNDNEIRNIDLLKDVEMNVSVELGRKQISLGKILQLMKGSVLELDKLAGEPVNILVNGRSIAVGDVVVIDEHFGVRVSKLLAAHETIANRS